MSAQHTPGPCSACPWVQKGQPDITDELRKAAARGAWFCCHVHLGDCHGAARYAQSQAAIANATKEPTP